MPRIDRGRIGRFMFEVVVGLVVLFGLLVFIVGALVAVLRGGGLDD